MIGETFDTARPNRILLSVRNVTVPLGNRSYRIKIGLGMQRHAMTHHKCARWGSSLTHEGMRALGAPAGPAPAGPLAPDDGTDDGAAAGGHEDERNSVHAH